MAELPMKSLFLMVPESLIQRFFLILQQGFGLKVHSGCTVEELLCQQLGLSPEYLEERIQTILVDGNPIDDVTSAYVLSGSTLALSAALPGLAGASLRRGGYYAPLRSQISYTQTNVTELTHEGLVFLKLFNLSLKDLGPFFLSQGILVKGKDLSDFFRIQSGDFWEKCRVAEVDGKRISLDALRDTTWQEEHIFLRVLTR